MAAPHRHSIRHGQGPNLPVLQVLQVLQAGSVSDPRSAVTARAAPCRPAGRGPLRLPCLDAVPDGVSAVLCPERGTPNPTARRRTRRVPRPPSVPRSFIIVIPDKSYHGCTSTTAVRIGNISYYCSQSSQRSAHGGGGFVARAAPAPTATVPLPFLQTQTHPSRISCCMVIALELSSPPPGSHRASRPV